MSDCSLCTSTHPTTDFVVEESPTLLSFRICEICHKATENPLANRAHWQCLTKSMWSEDIGVKITAYRLLKALSSESFASDALDMLYIEDKDKGWADTHRFVPLNAVPTVDANGASLAAGDTVTLIKDLVVKGAGFTAKRGLSVRGISLTDNPEHIEGRVNGQRIVIISAYVKKA